MLFISTEHLDEREKRLKKVINFIEDEIEIRLESIKLELDNLNLKLLRKVNKIQNSAICKLRKLDEFENKIETINEIMQNTKSLNTFKFVHNADFLPSYYHVGYLNDLHVLNIHKIKTNLPNIIVFDNALKYPTSMCNLNNTQLIVTDNQQNEICILDSNLKYLKRISNISGLRFNGPRGISTNNTDSVYICDTGNDRVVITDINFTIVKRIIGKKGKSVNQFDWPTDVCFYDGNIFVLDEINYRVQRFNSLGDFKEVMYAKKLSPVIERSNIFKKISVDNDLIAISNKYFVYIIDFNGNELLKLGNLGVPLKSLFLNGSYLITHNTNGSIICYGLETDKNNQKSFKIVFERAIDAFKKQTSSITKFNNKLLFLCMCDNLLVEI